MTREEFKQFIGMRLIDLLVVSPTPSEEGLALIFQDSKGFGHRAPPIPINEVKSPDYSRHAAMLNDKEQTIADLQEVIKNLNKEIAAKTKVIALYKSIIEEMEKP